MRNRAIRRPLIGRWRAAGAATLAVLLGVSVVPTAANAADGSLGVKLVQSTGTPGWDDLDGSAENDLIRTNDMITYNVPLSSRGEVKGKGVYYDFVAPRGTEVTSLPPYCGTDSKITPATLPAPAAPITGTSWNSLPQQTVRCFLADASLGDNTEQNFPVEVRVRPEVPNGTKLTASVTAGGTGLTTTAPATIVATVVAKARYDFSKNALFTNPNTVSLPTASRMECSFGEPGRQCLWTYYTLTASVPLGGKGNTPLTEFSFTDDLSPLAYYGVDMSAADKARYGANLLGCQAAVNYVGVPGSKAGNTDQAVRNSGTVTCTQQGGPGTPVTVKVTNADTTAWTYPTKDQAGRDLSTNRAAVFSQSMRIQVPVEAVMKWGKANAANTSFSLPMNNTIKSFAGTDIAGNSIDPTADIASNNYRNTNFVLNVNGAVSKLFAGVPGTPGNVPVGVYESNNYWEGPAGVSSVFGGDGQVFPGSDIYSSLNMRNGTSPELTAEPLTIGVCDYWDNTLVQLQSKSYPSGRGVANTFGSGGSAVWVGGGVMPPSPGAPSITVKDPATLPDLKIVYTNEAVSGPGFDCTKVSKWYSDPKDVPGNDPAQAAKGIFTAVNGVRVVTELPTNIQNSAAIVNIGMRVVDGVKPGTIIPNYRANIVFPRGGVTEHELNAAKWALSPYNMETNAGGSGDRVIVSDLISRVQKTIKNAAGTWTPNIIDVTSGATYTYRLVPTLNAGMTEGKTPKVIVEDCLPEGQIIERASMPYLTARQPDSTLACDSGTYLYFNLGAHKSTDKLDPITYDVRISNIIDPGTYTNTTQITAVGDSSAAKLRTDDQQVRIVNPAGVKIEKSPASPQTEVNRDPKQANNERVQWDITSANVGQYPGVQNIDMIDVLPKNGHDPLAGTKFSKGPSQFSGTLELASVTKVKGTKSEVWYTNVDQSKLSTDPKDPSNSTNGAASGTDPRIPNPAVWSKTPPADMSTVTGVRVKHDGPFAGADNFSYRMVFTPHGNVSGDKYLNTVYAMATVLTSTGGFIEFRDLGPIASAVDVVGGSIGDYVWYDTNGNGVQDAGEPAAHGVTVKLTGTDKLGNAIALETKTDASGHYTFANLHSSDAAGYQVQFVAPNGEYFTVRGAGNDRAVDSDASQADGKVAPIALTAGEELTDIDAGLVKPGIDLVKTATPESGLKHGDKVTYTFTATNTGSMPLENVALSEKSFVNAKGTALQLDSAPVLDAAASTGTTALLGIGQKLVWTAEYTVTETDALVGDHLDNTASVQAIGKTENSVKPTVTAESDAAVHIVRAKPAIELVKSADPVRGLSAGDTVTYTFTATNTGDVTLHENRLAEQDFANAAGDRLQLNAAPVLDTAASTGTLAALKPGEKLVWTAQYTVTKADIATTGPISNTAIVTGNPMGPVDPVRSEDGVKVYPKGVPGIDLVKTVNGDDANVAPGVRVPAGSDVKFEYLVTNTGNTTLTDVKVSDDQGVQISFPADFDGTLKPGGSVTGKGSGAIPKGRYTNIGTATGVPVDAQGEPVLDENGTPISEVKAEDPANVFGGVASYTVRKEVQDARGKWHSGDDRPTLAKGATAHWRVTVENTGNIEIEHLVIDDARVTSGSKTIVRLEAGESVNWQFTSKVGAEKLENVVVAELDSPYCQQGCQQQARAGYGTKQDPVVPVIPVVPGGPGLPITGGTIGGAAALAALLFAAGGVLLVARRRRGLAE